MNDTESTYEAELTRYLDDVAIERVKRRNLMPKPPCEHGHALAIGVLDRLLARRL